MYLIVIRLNTFFFDVCVFTVDLGLLLSLKALRDPAGLIEPLNLPGDVSDPDGRKLSMPI